MSLEMFTKKEIAELFKFLKYKYMAYVLLALKEIQIGTFSQIERCINKHRLSIPAASLRKTLKAAVKFDLILNTKGKKRTFQLTEFGQFVTTKIEKILACLAANVA